MTAEECESIGAAIEGAGGATATPSDRCPAAMSEAECRVLGEAYEAATK
jgi:hypothetical protein